MVLKNIFDVFVPYPYSEFHTAIFLSVAPTVMNVSSLSPITNHSYQPPDGKIVLSSYWGHTAKTICLA